MCFLNQGLTNQAKKMERDKYRFLPRCSARLATPREQEDNESKGSNFKILHYCNKFWKATPAGYLIKKVTDIHFSEDPNKGASKEPEWQEGGTRKAKQSANKHREDNILGLEMQASGGESARKSNKIAQTPA
jgi:hypothetical protein